MGYLIGAAAALLGMALPVVLVACYGGRFAGPSNLWRDRYGLRFSTLILAEVMGGTVATVVAMAAAA